MMSRADDSVDDCRAIEQCLAGDLGGLGVLWRRYDHYLVCVVAFLLGEDVHKQDPEDLAEEVWLKLSAKPQRLGKYKPAKGSFRSFLFLLARSEVSLYRRKLERRRLPVVALNDYDPRDPRRESWLLPAEWEEFLPTVTGLMRQFVQVQLEPTVVKQPRSAAEQKRVDRFRERFYEYFGCA